ncbi:hypothetical protein HFP15_41465 [Amycolatopsis sp. K13G38]|uniref:Uncharacterized protein n=2 Tax=Amycolatopsis acididurans TaxID=2724524 RepID=A0ABX1JHQ0_9PSEU|nr:hypothetical protein [Amycolatopsis acididurans]
MSAEPVTRKQPEVERVRPCATPVTIKEISEMLMNEELARARIQELSADLREQRARGNARAARRWARMARWATRRARRYSS